ncbi:MAG: hypothetical protein COA84_13995 [Robiginitomaculum sp.]|nr:MAG: hypothetical protein COA84_13995 [Robiginitomaculum sp.]
MFIDEKTYGRTTLIIYDEFYDSCGSDIHVDLMKEKDWKRTRFVSGGEHSPDSAKRAKLRAKRKK